MLGFGRRPFARRGARNPSHAPFVPTDLAGCVIWLRGDRNTITIATGVSQWNDQSGNGHNCVQGTGANQPTYNASDAAYNHQPTLTFTSASSQRLTCAGFSSLAQPATAFVVGNFDGTITAQGLFDFDTTEMAMYNHGSGTLISCYAGTALDGTIASNATPAIFACIFNGATSKVFRNSVTPLATGTANTNNGSGQFGVGSLTSLIDPLNGKIAEVIIYNNLLSTTSMQQVFAYLGARYAIQTS